MRKKGESFSFYAYVTLREAGEYDTGVTVELTPESAVDEEYANAVYEKFLSRFFRLMSEPAQYDPFSSVDDGRYSNSYRGGRETKYCSNCGAVIDAKAVVCPKCGCSLKTEQKSSIIGILAIIFSVLGGWLGLVLSIVGLFYYKEDDEECVKGLTYCKIGLGISIAWIVIAVLIFTISFAML